MRSINEPIISLAYVSQEMETELHVSMFPVRHNLISSIRMQVTWYRWGIYSTKHRQSFWRMNLVPKFCCIGG